MSIGVNPPKTRRRAAAGSCSKPLLLLLFNPQKPGNKCLLPRFPESHSIRKIIQPYRFVRKDCWLTLLLVNAKTVNQQTNQQQNPCHVRL